MTHEIFWNQKIFWLLLQFDELNMNTSPKHNINHLSPLGWLPRLLLLKRLEKYPAWRLSIKVVFPTPEFPKNFILILLMGLVVGMSWSMYSSVPPSLCNICSRSPRSEWPWKKCCHERYSNTLFCKTLHTLTLVVLVWDAVL